MCHGWRRTGGSPLFSLCTHNKIDDFWRGEGRGAGGRLGAAHPDSVGGGEVVAALWLMASPAHTFECGGRWRGVRRREEGRETRRPFALLQGWEVVLARSYHVEVLYVGSGQRMLLCTCPYPRNQKSVLLSPCWDSALTPEHIMELHHPQDLPCVQALLHLKFSSEQKERASPNNHLKY